MDDAKYLKMAIDQAKKSVEMGGFPAGAIVVKDDEVISEGISIGNKLSDPTAHAESVAIREACSKLATTSLAGATLYASLQPCLMCFSAANWAGISRIVFGCKKSDEMVRGQCYEGNYDIYKINELNSRQIELVYLNDFEPEILKMIDGII